MARRKRGPEAELLDQCLKQLELLARFCPLVWVRLNSGNILTGGRMIRLAPAGTPDLLVGGRGKVLFVELKAPKGAIRKSQREWADRAKAAGVSVYVARTLDEFVGCLRTGGVVPDWGGELP